MFRLFDLNKLPDKYYNFWINFINFKNKIKLLPINFKSQWWDILYRQKYLIILATLGKTVTTIFYNLVPLLIERILDNRFYLLKYVIISWILSLFIDYITIYFSSRFEIQSTQSVEFSAYTFFLTVDPIYHTKKATGQLFAKIARGARAYEGMSDLLIFDLVPVIASIATVIFSLWNYNSYLAFLSFGLLLIIMILNVSLTFLSTLAFEQKIISADDIVKNITMESLSQVQLIRSSFASNEIIEEAEDKSQQLMYKQGTFWLAFSAVNLITKLAYVISFYFIGRQIVSYIQGDILKVSTGIALLITYLRGTNQTLQVGRKIRLVLKNLTRINDLFNFINSFGKQTFPVLGEKAPCLIKQAQDLYKDNIELKADNIYFKYTKFTQIFTGQSLNITVAHKDKNKLYGIIGPSGSGKTTLISILGGQLNPTIGSVLLDGIDIYSIGDYTRRNLIALQGQVASSLSGTLRNNLLLGMPKDGVFYTDDKLILILEKIGLWYIFESKEGLNTHIGEGGHTMSGGQRQRLNFANLYLRAKFFNPILILIDEPTSSLDQVSEKAITKMIDDLARNALTFVIAHRIKTLDTAKGIIDFSLLNKSKEIKVYTQDKLFKVSEYYRKLIKNDIDFT